jgi:outer membrane murein-binding lipoprotein Lpp
MDRFRPLDYLRLGGGTMTKLLYSTVLAAAWLAGCSGAGLSSEEKAALETRLQALKAENAKLSGQVGNLGEKAFDRATKAEHQRGLDGSRILGGSGVEPGGVVLGPLKFKRKSASFDLDPSGGGGGGGLEDYRAVLRPRGGGRDDPSGHEPQKPTKKPGKKKKVKKPGKKPKKGGK